MASVLVAASACRDPDAWTDLYVYPGSPPPRDCTRDVECVVAPTLDPRGCCLSSLGAQTRAFYDYSMRRREEQCEEICWSPRLAESARSLDVTVGVCRAGRCTRKRDPAVVPAAKQ